MTKSTHEKRDEEMITFTFMCRKKTMKRGEAREFLYAKESTFL